MKKNIKNTFSLLTNEKTMVFIYHSFYFIK
uniref:Uncharacterized protein n=1 Tax=Myoviridae sp. ctWb16 TaxID=2827690 RepID=A0A8S5T079_9CAUD|nr:MAG TPA: hypothetical protein [Myoviridae sp. ctWb16]